MDIKNKKIYIAKRAAKEIKNNDIVNLGIGLPTLVADYIDHNIIIHLHSENGFIDMGKAPSLDKWDKDIVNASGLPATIKKGGAFFDSSVAFGIIRGGFIDKTILGALEVDENGSLASWYVPGKKLPGMGGAMDLVVGAKKVIVTMLHTINGKPKILKNCTLPLTAKKEVDMIITDMAVINVTNEGLILKEYNPIYSIDDIIKSTEAKLIVNNPKKMSIE